MNLRKSLLLALLLFVVGLDSWELYWRSQGYIAGLEYD